MVLSSLDPKLLIQRDCSPNLNVKDAKDYIKRLDEFCFNNSESDCIKKLKTYEEEQKKEQEINIGSRLDKTIMFSNFQK